MIRALGAAIAIVLAAGVVGALTEDGRGTLDVAGAERCGIALARHVGLDPASASARIDKTTFRVSVSVRDGAFVLVVQRDDGRVLEAAIVGPGGPQTLDRDARLAIYERGC